MPAFTLAQMAQTEEGKLRKGIYKGLYMQSLVADILTFKDTGGVLSIGGLREDEVIQPDWTALDDSINSKTANVKPIRWSTYQMLVHLDIPEAIHENGGDQISGAKSYMVQSRAALKGAALEMNDVFINGDQAVDPNQPEGLNKLVHQLGSGQRYGATEIDVSDGGDSTEQMAVVDRLLEAHSMVNGGKPTHAFSNRTTANRLRSIFLRNNMLGDHHNWVKDTFQVGDNRVTFSSPATKPMFIFDDVPYYDLGNKVDQTTPVIGNAYAEGGSAAATRIFLIRQGEDDIEGLQSAKLDIKEIGLLEDKDNRRWRLKWQPGIACWGPQSIVKVQGIKVA